MKIVSCAGTAGVLAPIRVVASNPTGYAVRVETYVEVREWRRRKRREKSPSGCVFFVVLCPYNPRRRRRRGWRKRRENLPPLNVCNFMCLLCSVLATLVFASTRVV